ncbi:MAG: hypothetical protein IPJ81_07620 [Chitinophagaceae bacterium]|nr:hypothetical protein [Chitinophagaceae bacterium]
MLESNQKYYTIVANSFTGDTKINLQALKNRRNVLISLANLSDAFSRMLSEPKRFQKGIKTIHKFVVLNYMLTSHLATLAYYLNISLNNYRSKELLPVIENTSLYFDQAIHCLQSGDGILAKPSAQVLNSLNEYAASLLDLRKQEILKGQLETGTKKLLIEVKSVIDQFNYIFSLAADIARICKSYE